MRVKRTQTEQLLCYKKLIAELSVHGSTVMKHKKTRNLILAACLASACGTAWGDTIFGLYGGVGHWYIDLQGDVGQNGATTTLNDLGFENENSNVFWLALEHPVPVIPNLRLMHSTISATESSITSQSFIIGGVLIDAQVQVLTDIDLSHTDATFYYELLDNWVTFDLGVTARFLEGYVEVQSELSQPARATLEGVLPMAYANLQLDFPGSGWRVGATAQGITYRGDKMTDASVRLGYSFEVTPLLDIGVNVGYRVLTLRAEKFDDLYADAKMSGTFAELVLHF